MAQRTSVRTITIGFVDSVEIYPGLTIPEGTYSGKVKQTTIDLIKGPASTRPIYLIKLSAEQMKAYGSTVGRGSDWIEFDVTKFFHLGLAYVV
ncbi:MAG: hypothetical protein R3D70_09240 [Rhizobiaceae bacterium]